MIEDKKIGLKIAEDKEEEFWTKAKEKVEQSIFNSEKEIEINKEVLKLCNDKLKNYKKQNI